MTDETRTIPVIVVVPPRVLLLDIAGPIEALRKANLVQSAVRFDVRYVGPRTEAASSIGLTIKDIAPLPDSAPEGALVMIVGAADAPLRQNFDEGRKDQDVACDAADEAAIVRWLAQIARKGVKIVTVCSGALLAGRAGLLDDYDCATHHACVAELERLAPKARVRDNRLYVVDKDRLSSAGITAGIDLTLHIIAQTAGHAAALAVARYLVVYMRRGPDDPQISPWLEGRNHIHPAIHKAQDAIAANPAFAWSVSELAKTVAASPRNLSRLFNDHVGMSVTDYVNRMRIALAREFLAGSRLDMEAIAERAGFSSARHLRRIWRQMYDDPPSFLRQASGGRAETRN